MKNLTAIILFLIASTSFARTLENCKTVEVLNTNVFEESLSVDEYPNVTIEEDYNSLSISIGNNHFENDLEYIVSAMPIAQTAGNFGYIINGLQTTEVITVTGNTEFLNGKMVKKGLIRYSLKGPKMEVIAKILCK